MAVKLLNKKIILPGVLVIVVAAGGVWAAKALVGHLRNTSASAARSAGSPIPVRLGKVEQGAIEEVIGLEGILKESRELPVQPQTSGQIQTLNVRLGDRVRQGTVIATLDGSVAESNLANARNKLANAQEQLRITKKKYERIAPLLSEGLITTDELEKATAEVVKAEDTLSEMRAKLNQAIEELEITRLVAPASGIVTTLDQVAGVVTKSFNTLLTLSVIDPVHFEVGLNQEKLRSVRVGQTVEVSFTSFPGKKFQGVVALINPVVDEKSQLMTVVIRLENKDLALMPGMRGVAVIANKTSGLKIPGVSLLSQREDTAQVFIVDKNNVARLRPVKTGLNGGGSVQILEGVAEGENVVVVGQAGLRDNDKVRIGDEYAPQ
jgi:membrane fusion protein (multidrug efflux system)